MPTPYSPDPADLAEMFGELAQALTVEPIIKHLRLRGDTLEAAAIAAHVSKNKASAATHRLWTAYELADYLGVNLDITGPVAWSTAANWHEVQRIVLAYDAEHHARIAARDTSVPRQLPLDNYGAAANLTTVDALAAVRADALDPDPFRLRVSRLIATAVGCSDRDIVTAETHPHITP